eukprot:jgi/Antlo1/1575/2009
MGTTQSSVKRCLVVLRVNDNSRCFPHISPFIHAIVKYNSIPIQSEDDIKKMATQRYLDLEILDLINGTTKNLAVETPLGIGVKFCVPRLLELKVLEIEKGSPAEKRITEGDFVVGIENFYFETNDEFFYAIYRNRGAMLNFIVYREGQVRRVPIKLNTSEPFLGAVFGEGILMTAVRSGNVVNIGTQREYQLCVSGAASEDTSDVQYNTEKMANGKLQGAEGEAPDSSNVTCSQGSNSKVECAEERVQEMKNNGNTNTETYVQVNNIQETKSTNEGNAECIAEGEHRFSGANKGQGANETPCDSEPSQRSTSMCKTTCPEHAEVTCSVVMHENYFSKSKYNESISVLGTHQLNISTEHIESQKDIFTDRNEVISDHVHATNEVSDLDTSQATSADHVYSLCNSETTLEDGMRTCPIIGEYSNEDKIRLLETLTGSKSENTSEPE